MCIVWWSVSTVFFVAQGYHHFVEGFGILSQAESFLCVR